MKLFQRIFATFCMVIICAIFVASFSVWLLQTRMVETIPAYAHHGINLLSNALTTFQAQGEDATRNLLERWRSDPSAQTSSSSPATTNRTFSAAACSRTKWRTPMISP